MNISDLLNPAPVPTPVGLRTLPSSVTKAYKRSKNFPLDNHGFIILTPPRRTIPREKQEFVPIRPEFLFGTDSYAPRYPAVCRLCQEYTTIPSDQQPHPCPSADSDRSDSKYDGQSRYRLRRVSEQDSSTALSDLKHLNIESLDSNSLSFIDMSDEFRSARSEEERRIRDYEAMLAMKNFMYPPPAATWPDEAATI